MNNHKISLAIAVVLLMCWSLIPIYYVLDLSLMEPVEIFTVPTHLVPYQPTLNNFLNSLGVPTLDPYTKTFTAAGLAPWIKLGLRNSTIIALTVTIITLAVATPAGYVLGRYKLPSKNKLLFLLVGSRSLPPVTILVPYYFFFSVIGLIGTIQGMTIAYLGITLPIITWILMGFFGTLPLETEKAARVDGMTRTQAFIRVVAPMAAPGIGACGMITFLLCWNEFVFAWVLASGTPAQTLPATIGSMFAQWGQINIMAASVMIGMIVPIAVAVFFQRYITQLRIVDPVTVVGV